MEDGLQILLLNPWNAVVAVSMLVAIEVLKYTSPVFFAGRGNRLLRIMCVAGCVAGYQIPGPWDSGDLVMNLFVGGFVGGVTTVGYALFADAFGFLKTKSPEEAGSWLDVAKKLGTTIIGLIIAASGIYGAWLRPETKARDGYELTSKAVELLSQDLNELAKVGDEARTQTRVDLAVLTQRLDDVCERLDRRAGRKATGHVTMAEPTVVMPEEQTQIRVQEHLIERRGKTMTMPAAREVF